MAIERTLSIIKPDAVAAGHVGAIVSRYEDAGLRLAADETSYAEALAEAQQLGYAERDPTADVEGYDAGAKAAILASLAFGAKVVLEALEKGDREGGKPATMIDDLPLFRAMPIAAPKPAPKEKPLAWRHTSRRLASPETISWNIANPCCRPNSD